MDKVYTDLMRIKGIGKMIAARLVAAGIDSYEKVASAGESVLKSIKGVNHHTIPAIMSQAAEFAAKAAGDRVLLWREQATVLRGRVNELAERTRQTHGDDLLSRTGERVEREFDKLSCALDRAAAASHGKNWVGKRLAKAEKRIAAIDETTMRTLRKSLKKTRKILKKFR